MRPWPRAGSSQVALDFMNSFLVEVAPLMRYSRVGRQAARVLTCVGQLGHRRDAGGGDVADGRRGRRVGRVLVLQDLHPAAAVAWSCRSRRGRRPRPGAVGIQLVDAVGSGRGGDVDRQAARPGDDAASARQPVARRAGGAGRRVGARVAVGAARRADGVAGRRRRRSSRTCRAGSSRTCRTGCRRWAVQRAVRY